MSGKGSTRRPTNEAAYGRNYEAIRWAARKDKVRRFARIVRHADPVEK
jgi:hypothetical protein